MPDPVGGVLAMVPASGAAEVVDQANARGIPRGVHRLHRALSGRRIAA